MVDVEAIPTTLEGIHVRVILNALSWHFDDVMRMSEQSIAELKEPFLGMDHDVYLEQVGNCLQRMLKIGEEMQVVTVGKNPAVSGGSL